MKKERFIEILFKVLSLPLIICVVLLADWLGYHSWIGVVVLICSTIVTFALILLLISRSK
jgi:hypothetical protein